MRAIVGARAYRGQARLADASSWASEDDVVVAIRVEGLVEVNQVDGGTVRMTDQGADTRRQAHPPAPGGRNVEPGTEEDF